MLHVGCGHRAEAGLHEAFHGPDWVEVRLDIDPEVRPDVVASITDMAPVPPACVDAVYSHHNIEHLFAHEVARAFWEFFRVLRPGGDLLLATPDLQGVARAIAAGRLEEPLFESPSGPITPLDIVYGHRSQIAEGRAYMAHRTGFTRAALVRRLGETGFEVVEMTSDSYELWAHARRPG